MRIIVNDANILIDIVELSLLQHFFRLSYEFQTTAAIIAELIFEQQAALDQYIQTGKLIVVDFTEGELTSIYELNRERPSLSPQDCSAYYQAKKVGGILITGDNSLKRYARMNQLESYGHLWVFDKLVESGILSGPQASAALSTLTEYLNPRLGLPIAECEKRHTMWLSA